MKRVLVAVLLVFSSMFLPNISSAVPIDGTTISYSLDWNGKGFLGPTRWATIDNPSYSFSFGDLEIPEGAVIDSAELVLTHQGNRDRGKIEAWNLNFNGEAYKVDESSRGWTQQSFDLGNLSGVQSLVFTLEEGTKGHDKINLANAILNVHYIFPASDSGDGDTGSFGGGGEIGNPSAPVPEPATMLLLGFGLVGLAGLGRTKFKKN
jgi:hypothetical protein